MSTQLLDLRPAHEVIEVVLDSEVDERETLALMLQVLEFLRTTDVWSLLCDFTEATQRATIPQVMALVELLPQLDLPTNLRQAILRPHDLNGGMIVDLWEAACNNRGFTVKVFRNRADALAWLNEQLPPAGPG